MGRLLLLFIIVLSIVSCSNSQDGSLQDAFSFVNDESQQPQGGCANGAAAVDSATTEGENSDLVQVDYSPYSALLKAYELDYNVENISATDYRVIGMTLTPTYPNATEMDLFDASGFCYANLIDLDNNGVLELVLIAYNDQEQNNYDEELDIYSLQYPNIVKVYTIVPEYGLEFLGSLPVSSHTMPVSVNYGIEYIVSDDKTYISHRDIYQMGDGDIQYYGLTNGHFSIETSFAIDIDGSYFIDGNEYTSIDFEQIKAGYGESEIHLIDNLNDTYLQEIEAINKATYDFLANYPIANFSCSDNAYNNGGFYFTEYVFNDLYPPEHTVKNYYHALTMQDYEALLDLGLKPEQVENIEFSHTSDQHTYVPGHIISDLKTVTVDMIENAEMANDIQDVVETLQDKNVTIEYCRVNEVLDPHLTPNWMQVAGGTYDTYFILSTDDPNEQDWRIEEIIDNKFYWD